MRAVTITLSIVAHVIGVSALIIAPLLATDTLPEPRSATEFVRVVPLVPPGPPPPVRRAPSRTIARPDAAPLTAPDGVSPEPPPEPLPDPMTPDDGLISFGRGAASIVDVDPVPPPQAPPQPLRVGGVIKPPTKIADAAPIYPAIAKAARVEGIVILEAVIDEDGRVADVRVLRSVPLLDAAAMEAVREWRFTPTLLNGQPVQVVLAVTVAFKLR